MGQLDSTVPAIRVRDLKKHEATIKGCAFHESLGQGFLSADSKNITFNDNVLFGTERNAVLIRGSSNVEMLGNLIIGNNYRNYIEGETKVNDYQVAVDICVGERISSCTNLLVQNNVVAGGHGIAYTAITADCSSDIARNATEKTFVNNVAHSTGVGLIAHIDNAREQPQCALVANFTAHHSSVVAVQSRYYFSNVQAEHLVLVDHQVGLELGLANGDNPNGNITLSDSLIIGEHRDTIDCEHEIERLGTRKVGMFSGVAYARYLELPYSYPSSGRFHSVNAAAPKGKEMMV